MKSIFLILTTALFLTGCNPESDNDETNTGKNGSGNNSSVCVDSAFAGTSCVLEVLPVIERELASDPSATLLTEFYLNSGDCAVAGEITVEVATDIVTGITTQTLEATDCDISGDTQFNGTWVTGNLYKTWPVDRQLTYPGSGTVLETTSDTDYILNNGETVEVTISVDQTTTSYTETPDDTSINFYTLSYTDKSGSIEIAEIGESIAFRTLSPIVIEQYLYAGGSSSSTTTIGGSIEYIDTDGNILIVEFSNTGVQTASLNSGGSFVIPN